MNAGATFQREMDIAFVGEKDKFVVIYLDDLTIFSKSDEDHLKHLKQTFIKCKKYGLSLNPKKSHFSMQEGKLLGHIVSKDGVKIDPQRVEAIQVISLPRNKKEIQSFLGKINFLRRFIPNFVEVVKDLTDMLKKDNEVKWSPEARYSFDQIKKYLGEAPVLASPDYSKEFLIFSFASDNTIVFVLLQRNEEKQEQPIAFFSKSLRDSELKYNIMEKQAYALVKALKYFRVYVLHSKIIAYVPSNTVKEILNQPDTDGKRGKWIAKIQEYDLEIKPTKLIKGQGLEKLLVESNCRVLGVNQITDITKHPSAENEETNLQQPLVKIHDKFSSSPWYKNIVFYLQNLECPSDFSQAKARSLKLQAIKYCIMNENIYWKDPLGIFLNCIVEDETAGIIDEFHKGICGGHHAWRATAYKILRVGYYWPKNIF
jgi:hypothetical protein